MNWLRWYHGTTTDPKLRSVAKNTATPLAFVGWIWAAILENASDAQPRGTLSNWSDEDMSVALEIPHETVETVRNAMKRKGMFHADGVTLTAWEKRNPKREREDLSTERVQRFRDKKRSETPSNAKKRPDKRRVEERREDKKGEGNGETARRTRAPASLDITDAMREWAKENGITADLNAETAAMLDHHRGKGNLHIDWVATWRTWMRNSKRFSKGNGNGKQSDYETRGQRIARLNREAADEISRTLSRTTGNGSGREPHS